MISIISFDYVMIYKGFVSNEGGMFKIFLLHFKILSIFFPLHDNYSVFTSSWPLSKTDLVLGLDLCGQGCHLLGQHLLLLAGQPSNLVRLNPGVIFVPGDFSSTGKKLD